MKARIITAYGQQHGPLQMMEGTWIEAEAACSDVGQFRRRAVARHQKTKELVECQAGIPDTAFSIPATTKTEHGYIAVHDTDKVLEFRPHTEQNMTPAEYRKQYKKDCK